MATASASSKGKHLRISIFSGVCKGMEESDSHSFIRVIDGVQAKSRYVDYPYSVFSFRKGLLDITVGKSNFRDNQISLNILDSSIKCNRDYLRLPQAVYMTGIFLALYSTGSQQTVYPRW